MTAFRRKIKRLDLSAERCLKELYIYLPVADINVAVWNALKGRMEHWIVSMEMLPGVELTGGVISVNLFNSIGDISHGSLLSPKRDSSI